MEILGFKIFFEFFFFVKNIVPRKGLLPRGDSSFVMDVLGLGKRGVKHAQGLEPGKVETGHVRRERKSVVVVSQVLRHRACVRRLSSFPGW